MNEFKELCNTLYLKNISGVEQKIPKIIHYIWLGSPLPDKYKQLIDLTRTICSEYQVNLWTDDNIPTDLVTGELYKSIQNPSAKTDVLRFELIYKYGGIYMDTDFYVYKNFDSILNTNFFAGAYDYDITTIDEIPSACAGIIGGITGNDFSNRVLLKLKNNPPKVDSIPEIMGNIGPGFVCDCIKEFFTSDDNYIIYPTEYFYSFPGVNRMHIRNITNLNDLEASLNIYKKDKTICSHLWYCSWQ